MASPASATAGSPPHNDITTDPVRKTVTWELLELQRRRGYLSDQDLIDLAERLDVHLIELEQVVGFFPHFRRSPPPKCELHVCRDLACAHRGAATILDHLTKAFPEPKDSRQTPEIAVRPVSCLGRCDRAPAVLIELPHAGDHADETAVKPEEPPLPHVIAAHGDAVDPTRFEPKPYAESLAQAARGLCDNPRKALAELPDRSDARIPGPERVWELDPYTASEGGHSPYAALEKLRECYRESYGDWAQAFERLGLLAALRTSNLRGMGGAGTPAERKWSEVAGAAAESKRKFVVCNADESEPLTFKDREILLRSPHLVIEGMVLAGLFCGATRGYIYLRHEYHEQADALRRALGVAARLGCCGVNVAGLGRDFFLDVFISPGGYICGEQSALIEALEGHRGQPRCKPPTLETNGLFNDPTLLSNVETFAWVPAILLGGAARSPGDGDPLAEWTAAQPAAKEARRAWHQAQETRWKAATSETCWTEADLPPPSPPDPSSAKGEPPVNRAPAAAGRWYASLGRDPREDDRGRRLFSLCGDVRRPGVYELPIGTPLRDLIAAAGGVVQDREVLAIATSGPSGGFLPAIIDDPDMIRGIDLAWRQWQVRMENGIDALLRRISVAVGTVRDRQAWLQSEQARQAVQKSVFNSQSAELQETLRRAQGEIDAGRRTIRKTVQELLDGSRSKYGEWRQYHRWKAAVESRDPVTGRRRFDLLGMPLDIDLFRTVFSQLLSTDRSAAEGEQQAHWRQPALLAINPGPLLGAGLGVFAKTGSPVEDRRLLAGLARNATEFFQRESCGKCVPCRVGSVRMVDRIVELQTSGRFERQTLVDEDWDELTDWVSVMDTTLAETSICALGASVSAPMVTLLKFFA